MAPTLEAYFPSLKDCLNGNELLWSWDQCYRIISQPRCRQLGISIRSFLKDQQTFKFLSSPLDELHSSSSNIKTSFKQRIDSLQGSTSEKSYNVAQIQADTQWLCEIAPIDEISGLRLAIHEWQRSLAAPYINQSLSTSTADVIGAFQDGSEGDDRSKQHNRRRRLLNLMLSESRNRIKTSHYLYIHAIRGEQGISESHSDDDADQAGILLMQLGQKLCKTWRPNAEEPISTSQFAQSLMQAIEQRMESLADLSRWAKVEDDAQDVYASTWTNGRILEISEIMKLLQSLLQTSPGVVNAQFISKWFKLMDLYHFFDCMNTAPEDTMNIANTLLQPLAGVISLTIMDVRTALDLIVNSASIVAPPVGREKSPFFWDSQTVQELIELLTNSATSIIASPCILAWSIILQTIREVSATSREAREIKQSNRAAEQYEHMNSLSFGSHEFQDHRSEDMRRRSSGGSDNSQHGTLLEDISENITLPGSNEDIVPLLAKHAVGEGRVFEFIAAVSLNYCRNFACDHNGYPGHNIRKGFLDLIWASLDFIDYQPTLVAATIAAAGGGETYWDLIEGPLRVANEGPAMMLRSDDLLRDKILLVAISRFPHESMPFLQLCRTIASQESTDSDTSIIQNLQSLDTFTCMLPSRYQDYRNIREDEESHFIELTRDFVWRGMRVTDLDTTKNGLSKASTPSDTIRGIVQITQGSQGQVISNSKPLVVVWNYEYSTLAYLGRILQLAAAGEAIVETASVTLSPALIAEAIDMFSILLFSLKKKTIDSSEVFAAATSVLNQASDDSDGDLNIVSTISQIMESQLFQPFKAPESQELDILIRCVQFLHAVLPIFPDRVWPLLGRSNLLGLGRDGNRLNVVVAAHEVPIGKYGFLLGCVSLLEALVEDLVQRSVQRLTPSKSVIRFGAAPSIGTGVSSSIAEKILCSFCGAMLDSLESLHTWRFLEHETWAKLTVRLFTLFNNILTYSYTVRKDKNQPSKLLGNLHAAANLVLRTLSTPKSVAMILKTVKLCGEDAQKATSELSARPGVKPVDTAVASLRLLVQLITINRQVFGCTNSIETAFNSNSELLATTFAIFPECEAPVIDLLISLSDTRSTTDSHLRTSVILVHDAAHTFIRLLAQKCDACELDESVVKIWQLFTAIIAGRQERLAQFLMAGTNSGPLKSRVQLEDEKFSGRDSIFEHSITKLRERKHLSLETTAAILQFVSTAIDHWPVAWSIIEQHSWFIPMISNFLVETSSGSPIRFMRRSDGMFEVKAAAYCAEILALHIRQTRLDRDSKAAVQLQQNLGNFSLKHMAVPTYNISLLGNLRKNFSAKFGGCDIDEFTQASPLRSYDLSDAQDIRLADKMLSYEPSWNGVNGQGFSEEFKRAKSNLCVVQAQIDLFGAWKTLILELSIPLAKDMKFRRTLQDVILTCLEANSDETLPPAVGQDMAFTRANFAFAISQVVSQDDDGELSLRILNTTWSILQAHERDAGIALTSPNSEYYRLLVKLLLSSLQPYALKQRSSLDSSKAQNGWSESTWDPTKIALEIISEFVAPGFRALTRLLHDSQEVVLPSDFAVLTTIFRLCLRIPNVKRNSIHLIDAFANSQASRSAAVLLSWSHEIANSTDGDPVYAELATSFLLEIARVPALAEHLAVEGVLSYMLSSTIMTELQGRPYGPYDTPQRIFSIWARGILPLLLSLLVGIGPSMANEVCNTLNSFKHQLERAEASFGSSTRGQAGGNFITLSMAQEAHCLAMLNKALRALKQAGASVGIDSTDLEDLHWDAAVVREDISDCLDRRAMLRDRIMPTNDREESWTRMKAKVSTSENMLEEKVIHELRNVLYVLE